MFIKMSAGDKAGITAATVLSFIGCGINISSVYILNELVKHLNESDSSIDVLVIGKYVGALAGASLLKQVADIVSQRAISSGVNKTTLNWVGHINQLSAMQHDELARRRAHIGQMFRIQESIYNTFKLGMIKAIPDCVQILGVAIASSYLFEAEIIPIFWATLFIRSLAFLIFSFCLVNPQQKKLTDTMNSSVAQLVDILSNFQLIKIHNKEKLSQEQSKQVLKQVERAQNNKDYAMEAARFVDNILSHTATFFIFYMTAGEVANEDLTFDISDFIVVITYFQLFLEPLNSLFSSVNSLLNSRVDIQISEDIIRNFELLNHAGVKLKADRYDFDISNLWFRYKSRRSEVAICDDSLSDSDVLEMLNKDYDDRHDALRFYLAKVKKDEICCYTRVSVDDVLEYTAKEILDGYSIKKLNKDNLDLTYIKNVDEKLIEAKIDKDKYILSGMDNINVKQGEVIAVVGKSGLGKTTFVQLLLGQYDNYEGQIKINGVELSTIDKTTLRDDIVSYLPQAVDLFENETLGFNLKHAISSIEQGNIDDFEYKLEDQNVRDAVEESESTPLLSRLENGYGAVVGGRISGGQKQRLGIARLRLRETKVYIMDEPTSSLDSDTEENIMRLLANFVEKQHATCFFITHKLAFAQNADKVLFFSKNGEYHFDTHDALFENCDEYQTMFSLQDQDNYANLWHPKLS